MAGNVLLAHFFEFTAIEFRTTSELIARCSYKDREIGFTNDPDTLTVSDKLLGLSVLRTLLMTGEPSDVLVADDEHRCLSRDARRDMATHACRQIGRFLTR